MIEFTASVEEILHDFEVENIPHDTPGFYDNPRFKELERLSPDFLNNYAKYVKYLKHDDEYLRRAERIIVAAARALAQEIENDGRQGACIDASISLSRMLDREGIWNYVVKGALAITLPQQIMLPRMFYYHVDYPKVPAGHVWISAPPFNIVDVTIKYQSCQNRLAFYQIPKLILDKLPRVSAAYLDEICSPEAIGLAKREGIRNEDILRIALPHLVDFHRDFPPLEVEVNGSKYKYIPAGIGASDSPLEEIKSLRLNNRYAAQIYNEVIRPAIAEAT
jgi:hypothetical protein